jgi:regulator of nonsense transcripts 1
MQQLNEKKEEQGELNEKDDKALKDLVKMAEDEILKNADVICTTCVAAFDRRLRQFRFR